MKLNISGFLMHIILLFTSIWGVLFIAYNYEKDIMAIFLMSLLILLCILLIISMCLNISRYWNYLDMKKKQCNKDIL